MVDAVTQTGTDQRRGDVVLAVTSGSPCLRRSYPPLRRRRPQDTFEPSTLIRLRPDRVGPSFRARAL
jgi:hypothetical protein